MPGQWLQRQRDRLRRASKPRLIAAAAGGCLFVALVTGYSGVGQTPPRDAASDRQLTSVAPYPRGSLPRLQKTTVPSSYVVQPGDTLSLIAGRFRVSEGKLQVVNHLPDADSLYSGQQLVIPMPEN